MGLSAWNAKFDADNNLSSNSLSTKHYVMIYLGICLITVACNFIRTVVQYRGSLRASNGLFHALLRAICRAPLQFFDNTTQGQIMSRFSKDMETVDSSIGWHVNFLLQTLFGVLGVVITIGIILPEFYIACIVAGKKNKFVFCVTYRLVFIHNVITIGFPWTSNLILYV